MSHRPPYRPPIGMPIAREDRWRGPIVSILLHAAVIMLLVTPLVLSAPVFDPVQEGGGGDGPAGGGGGGSGGTGGQPRRVEERLRYIEIAPEPDPVLPPIETPVPPPVMPPVVPPPEPVPVPEPVVEPPPPPPAPAVPEVKPETPPAPTPAASLVAGTGGGTGNDGTAGSGPGSGGGVGSGIGTGRGSGIGPGTGGGAGNIHNPAVIQVFMPPQPVPDRIRPYHIVAVFDVDERGKVIKFTFNESRDRDYNKKLRAMLNEVRFRPGTTLDGVPIRATAEVRFTAY